jgi:hypothetical protein
VGIDGSERGAVLEGTSQQAPHNYVCAREEQITVEQSFVLKDAMEFSPRSLGVAAAVLLDELCGKLSPLLVFYVVVRR